MSAPRKRLVARKLDYRHRLRLLKGASRRVIVRLTHNHFLLQYVETQVDARGLCVDDKVRFTCSTYGKKTHLGNDEATVRAVADDFKKRLPCDDWVFDFGLVSPRRRPRYLAVMEVLR
jgi:ribosomal protein L18